MKNILIRITMTPTMALQQITTVMITPITIIVAVHIIIVITQVMTTTTKVMTHIQIRKCGIMSNNSLIN